MTWSITHFPIVMLNFNFLQTFISYAWFIGLFSNLIFTIFYWFLSVISPSIVWCIGCRSQHVLLIILIINNGLIRFEIFTYTGIDCLSAYLITTRGFNFNHILDFIGVITSSLSIGIFLTAFSSNRFIWSNTFLSNLRLPSWWSFRGCSTCNNAHTIFF